MRHRLNLCSLPDRLVCSEPSLRIHQVRRKNSVDERRLSQTRLTCKLCQRRLLTSGIIFPRVVEKIPARKAKIRTNDNYIELEPSLQQLVLNLLCDRVKTDIGVGTDFFCCGGGHFSRGGRVRR